MALSFNEFQRELQKRGIDGHLAIILTEMYEQQRETAEQLTQTTSILVSLVDTVSNFVSLNDAMNGRLQELQKRVSGEAEGVSLSSVPLRDEPN